MNALIRSIECFSINLISSPFFSLSFSHFRFLLSPLPPHRAFTNVEQNLVLFAEEIQFHEIRTSLEKKIYRNNQQNSWITR